MTVGTFSFDTPGRSVLRFDEVTGGLPQRDIVDRAIAEAGWITRGGPLHNKLVERRRTGGLKLGPIRLFGRYEWRVEDQAATPHTVCRRGRAWTIGGGHRAAFRAYRAVLADEDERGCE